MGIAYDQSILVLRLYPRVIIKGVQKVTSIRKNWQHGWPQMGLVAKIKILLDN